MTLLNNRTITEEIAPPMSTSLTWNIVDAKDFDGNGSADILIRNTTSGAWYIYLYSDTTIINRGYILNLTSDLKDVIQGVGDFNGDGKHDVLLRNQDTHAWSIIYMNGKTPYDTRAISLSTVPESQFNAVNDLNGDGFTDITIKHSSSGQVFAYFMGANGTISSTGNIGSPMAPSLKAQSLNVWRTDDNADGGSGDSGSGDGGSGDGGSGDGGSGDGGSGDGGSGDSGSGGGGSGGGGSGDGGSGDGGSGGGGSGDGGNTTSPEDYFSANISTPVVQSRCVACHVQGGAASGLSRLLFVRSTTSNHEQINHNAFRDFLNLDNVTVNYIMSKASGGQGHIGGTQLSVGSNEYNNLETYLNMLSGNTGGNNGGTNSTEFWQGVTLLEPELTLRKAALQLTGTYPADAQLASMENASNSSLHSSVLSLMQGDGFHEFLLRSANDRLLTDKYIERGAEALDSNSHYLPAYANKAYEMRAAGQDEALWQWQISLQRGFARAPLELIAYVIENNLPYTEILTADYTMLNPYTNEAYRGDVSSFENSTDENEFKPGKVEGVMLMTDDVEANFSNDFGLNITQEGPLVSIPHAGILNDPAWLNRYPSTTTNRNRARSRWTYMHFLDFDVEKSAQRSQNPDDLADTNNPTMNNPNCNVCHQTLDPIAGAYQNYGDFGWYRDSWGGEDSLPDSYKREEDSPYIEGDTWYRTMRTPGFGDKDAPDSNNSLQWLAKEIVADPRFATAAVKFWWPAITGELPLLAPQDQSDSNYTALNEAYIAQSIFINKLATELAEHWDIKQIFADIIVSEWYRASANSSTAPDAHEYLVAGTEKLLTPEELDAKTKAITGYSWNERFPEWDNNRRRSGLMNDYRLSYGGIDSDGITERATEMTSVMSQIALAHAAESACPIVVHEYAKPDDQRLLFNGLTKSTTPGRIGSSEHEVSGQWAQNQRDYDYLVNINAGQHNATVSYNNDKWDDETGLNRDMIVNRIQVIDPQGQVILEFEGNEFDTVQATATCGGITWNEEEDTQHSTDWNLWGNCSIRFPFTADSSGNHRIRVNAYYMEWNDDGPIDSPAQGAGPAEMSIIAAVADPVNQTNPSADLIRQTIANLHFSFWGEKRNSDDPEVSRTFQLFVDSWNAKTQRGGWNHIAEESVACNIDFSQYDDLENDQYGWTLAGADPHSVMTAWKTVIAYLMTDYKYLHE